MNKGHVYDTPIWLDKSKLIGRWRYDATWATEVKYQRPFTVTLLEVTLID